MSKSFNADSAFEPIEITLGGKVYKIDDLTTEKFNQIAALSEKAKQEGQSVDVLADQLALLTGDPVDVFKKIDIRRMAAAIKFVSDEILASGKTAPPGNG